MTAEIIPFDFETTPVRVAMRNGESWWVAADVCRVLEISKHRDAVSRLDEDERALVLVDTPGGPQGMGAINESGLYALNLRSRKPAAQRFRKWVTAEVLPTLRREGEYRLKTKADKQEISATRLIELLEAENTLLRQKAGVKKRRRSPRPTTAEERAEIARLIEEGLSACEIGRRLGRSPSMISLFRSGMSTKKSAG